MPDPRSSPASDDLTPRSGAPTVASAPPGRGSTPPGSKLPVWISAIGLLGVAGFVLLRLTTPLRHVAADCLQAALADSGHEVADLELEVEIVMAGKLEVGGKSAAEVAKGPLSDPVRRRAIEQCRAVYAERAKVSAKPLIRVETAVARVGVERTLERGGPGDLEVQLPVPGAQVSVENHAGQGVCVTSTSGDCELVLRDLAHDARLSITARRSNGSVVSRSTTLLELLQRGLTLEAVERPPALTFSVLSCSDRSPLSGVIVQASAVGSNLWSSDCGSARPEPPDKCREMLGRHGEVSFYYDKRPEQLTLTIIPPGEGPRETREVVPGATNAIELTYGACEVQAPAPSVDCQAARRAVEEHAQLTRVPAAATGHQLDVLVELMSSGIVSDIEPAAGSDPKALAALRSQLAGLRGLPGPCRDLPISLRY